jgi:hypothetical protein
MGYVVTPHGVIDIAHFVRDQIKKIMDGTNSLKQRGLLPEMVRTGGSGGQAGVVAVSQECQQQQRKESNNEQQTTDNNGTRRTRIVKGEVRGWDDGGRKSRASRDEMCGARYVHSVTNVPWGRVRFGWVWECVVCAGGAGNKEKGREGGCNVCVVYVRTWRGVQRGGRIESGEQRGVFLSFLCDIYCCVIRVARRIEYTLEALSRK